MIPDITASDVSWFHYLVIPPILFMLLAAVNTLAGTDQQAELFRAVMSGNIEAIRTALDNGAEVNAVNADDTTVLMLAAVQAEEMLARLLLDHKAKVNLRNSNGMTAWIMSAHYLDLAT